MLDVGSPRVLNCNYITRKILAEDPNAKLFFRCRPLNNLVLIKDTDPQSRSAAIGTKLYFPFNENEIYEGGRTIFVHNKYLEQGLIDNFGEGDLPKASLDLDMRVLKILDKLPSLDPFLLKDVFINEKIDMNPSYFEVDKILWDQIESYILQGFETLAKAAFPDALSSDEVARKLIEKIWEGRDLEALQPLIIAFRLPQGKELEIFAAWKGINFYGFEYQRALPQMKELSKWLNDIQVPIAAGSVQERNEIRSIIETIKGRLKEEKQEAEGVLQEYQESYDKMFKYQSGSSDFLKFLQNSSKSYWTIGNCLGKIGHAIYCWDSTASHYPERRIPWEQTSGLIVLLAKILSSEKKMATASSWT